MNDAINRFGMNDYESINRFKNISTLNNYSQQYSCSEYSEKENNMNKEQLRELIHITEDAQVKAALRELYDLKFGSKAELANTMDLRSNCLAGSISCPKEYAPKIIFTLPDIIEC